MPIPASFGCKLSPHLKSVCLNLYAQCVLHCLDTLLLVLPCAHLQGAITGHEDPSSVLVLVEGGQVLLYDLTAVTGQQQQQQLPTNVPAHGKLAEQRSGSPSKHRPSPPQPEQQQQQQPERAPAAPPVQLLFRNQLQRKPLVTAARLRMIPIQPVPLRGLQVGRHLPSGHCVLCSMPCIALNAMLGLVSASHYT